MEGYRIMLNSYKQLLAKHQEQGEDTTELEANIKVYEVLADLAKEKYEENKKIKEVIKTGMPILVQVKRDFTASKGAKVSTHISINSRYIVLMPNTTIITISQKIEDEAEKERLINIAKKYLPENCGAIIRTSAENEPEEKIKNVKQINQ